MYIINMKYEYDMAKNRLNLQEHLTEALQPLLILHAHISTGFTLQTKAYPNTNHGQSGG